MDDSAHNPTVAQGGAVAQNGTAAQAATVAQNGRADVPSPNGHSGDGRLVPPYRVLAVLRIFFGGVFVVTWFDNLDKGLYSADGYESFIRYLAENTDFGFMAWFLDNAVAPNAGAFSTGQLVVELVFIGLPLVFGLLTPVAAGLAAGFSLNLLLASWGTGEWPGVYFMMIAIALTLLLTQSGRTWGIDALLARRRPRPKVPVY